MNFEKPEKSILNIEKMKKTAGDTIILHMCTKNHSHMRHSSLDMETIFFVILGRFLPFHPPSPSDNPENQNSEKIKRAAGDVLNFI